jgi:hypothetical protein
MLGEELLDVITVDALAVTVSEVTSDWVETVKGVETAAP